MEGCAHQTGYPVVIAWHITAVKSSLKTCREAPYVQAVSLNWTLVWVASLDLICCRYSCQLSFLSSITPRTCREMLGWIVEVGKRRGQALLSFVIALVKCTMVYFYGTNKAPCLSANFMQHLLTVCCILQSSSVDLPYARDFTSSTK
jgi:hypothetical protein